MVLCILSFNIPQARVRITHKTFSEDNENAHRMQAIKHYPPGQKLYDPTI